MSLRLRLGHLLFLAPPALLHAQSLPWCGPPCLDSDGIYRNYVTAGQFPYTEHIAGPPNRVPYILLTDSQWKLIQGSCKNNTLCVAKTGCATYSALGNIIGSEATHTLLRGLVGVHGDSTSAAPGTRIEVQLRVDGAVAGSYLRRIDGHVPGTDMGYSFEATAQSLSAGPHNYELYARILDPGTVAVNGWITAVGVPASAYHSQRIVNSNQKTIGTAWTSLYQPALPILQLNPGSLADLALQGYAQINANRGAVTVMYRFVIDGQTVRQSLSDVPNTLPAGMNIVDHYKGLSSGSHTLDLQAMTDVGEVDLQWMQLEYVEFPGSSDVSPSAEDGVTIGGGGPKLVDSNTAEPQPFPTVQADGNGNWTLLATKNIPKPANPIVIGSWTLEGYVQFRGRPDNSGSSQWGQIAFEVRSPQSYLNCVARPSPPDLSNVDMGITNFRIPSGTSDIWPYDSPGMWVFGDGGQWGMTSPGCRARGGVANGEPDAGETTVNMWIRPVGAGNQFYVGDRYFSVKVVPAGSCACNQGDPTPTWKFYSIAPCRLADTRNAPGAYGGPALQGLQERDFQVSGACGIPAGAKAVAANVAVTGSTQTGALEIFPVDQAPTPVIPTSAINYNAYQTRSSNTNIGISCEGQLGVVPLQTTGSTVNFILDIYGYYQ